MTENGLISKIYEQLIQLNLKKTTQLKSGQNTWMDILVKEDVDGQQAHEKCSASLISREMQIKTTIRYHLIPVRMSIIKRPQ